ncbi:peroxiredoxin [Aliikangiella coralliicola]|nr:peroxiredoxin [Aliikangiella coralliicola]
MSKKSTTRFLTSTLLLTSFFLSFSASANSNVWEGTPFLSFSLADQTGKIRTNQEFSGKWLVVYFYPKDKTPGCTIEAQNFTDDYAKYQALGVEIVGVSYDDIAAHKDFAETYELPFTLLADTEAQLSKAMKVDRLLPWPHASRQTFLVNPQGIIVQHFKKVKPKEHSAELLKSIRRHQENKS